MGTEMRLYFTPEVCQGKHGGWTAICTELQVAAGGEEEWQARDRLREVVGSYARALQRLGQLTKAITESGIKAIPFERADDEDVVLIPMRPHLNRQ